jgi:hypothetical protein
LALAATSVMLSSSSALPDDLDYWSSDEEVDDCTVSVCLLEDESSALSKDAYDDYYSSRGMVSWSLVVSTNSFSKLLSSKSANIAAVCAYRCFSASNCSILNSADRTKGRDS